jgi:hypothetical protein
MLTDLTGERKEEKEKNCEGELMPSHRSPKERVH